MGYIIRMPKLGMEMEQGIILEWKVEEEDEVAEGDVIAEVESEKSIGEVECRDDGTLRRVYVHEGESVPPGTPIGIVAAPEADITDLETEAEAELAETTETTDEVEPTPIGGETAGPDVPSDHGTEPTDTGDAPGAGETDAEEETSEVKASPRARKRAEELGVDLSSVGGTGPQGAITADDVEAAEAAEDEGAADVKASPRAQKRADELNIALTTVDGTGPQGAITAADVEAAAEATGEADVPESKAEEQVARAAGATVTEPERLAPLRPEYHWYRLEEVVTEPEVADRLFNVTAAIGDAFDVDVSVTDVALIVLSATLADHPAFNATFEEATHHVHERRRVAIVVGGDGDVIAPVLNLEEDALADLVERRRDLTERALAGELSEAERAGATFTLANAAALDGEDESTGRLVNPPTVASLEMNPIRQRALPDDDAVDFQWYVTFDLTYDARAVDSDDARRFLDAFSENVTQIPELVLATYQSSSQS